jgi:hypothetical protein
VPFHHGRLRPRSPPGQAAARKAAFGYHDTGVPLEDLTDENIAGEGVAYAIAGDDDAHNAFYRYLCDLRDDLYSMQEIISHALETMPPRPEGR